MIQTALRHKRVLLFAAVGLVNTGVDFTIFFGLVNLFNTGQLPANCTAFGCAVCVSYVLNRNITFADHSLHQKNTMANLIVYVLVVLLALGGIKLGTAGDFRPRQRHCGEACGNGGFLYRESMCPGRF